MKRDWFTDAFGSAVSEVRQKLIEEPWFGRAVTAPFYLRESSMAEKLGWDIPSEKAGEQKGPEADGKEAVSEQTQSRENLELVQEQPLHQIEHDIER